MRSEDWFWNRVVVTDDCWLWIGALDRDGYGQLQVPGSTARAHRMAYELVRGRIPDGLTLDHLCENKRCVNPQHLEPVTSRENVRRYWAKVTHCKHGHEFTPENTYIRTNGCRQCRICQREGVARYKARKREVVA